ncbi:hypothetical protein ACFLWA_03855 [Chloroflexota bacterium]
MEQLFEVLGTVLRVMLAGMIALTPGMLVWTVVLSVFLAVRWVGRRQPFNALRR